MSLRETNRIKMAKWRALNPERQKEANRRADYRGTFGISVEIFEALLKKQRGVCALCGEAETARSNTKNNTVRRLSIDHCHATNNIRGLLCYRCNHLLGLCKDSTLLLRGAAFYLETASTGLKIKKEMPVNRTLSASDSVVLANSVIDDLMKL